ncbi:MAG TPA: hypothetical protein VFF53_11930 [Geobacteraceae bacterium]|nr:hypothetical protein [Geobacteraceae bacterium]
MKRIALVMIAAMASVMTLESRTWYVGDERCPPPKDDGTYSAPYNAIDHPDAYPTFTGADKPGWSCSYQRDDGVIVQYGDSRTPQEKWLSLWGNGAHGND